MLWLERKNIVIVGGTTGIGLSAAKAFIREGARVVVLGRDPENCRTAATTLGENARSFAADACQPDAAPRAIELCINAFGSFDGLYHVAGGSGRRFGDGPLHELTLEGWNRTFELNLTGLMLSNQAAVRHFLKEKTAGSILDMGSVLACSPSPNYFSTHAYAAAKSAVIGLIRATAAYYAPQDIRINGLFPALVETPMSQRAVGNDAIMNFIKTKQPLDGGRVGQPDDLDGAAVYFMSDFSKFTTGQILTVDGGWSVS